MGGFREILVHPRGSWVPWKPFPSKKLLGNLVGDQSLHKIKFFGSLVWLKNDPWAFGNPDLDRGVPNMGSGVETIKVAG